ERDDGPVERGHAVSTGGVGDSRTLLPTAPKMPDAYSSRERFPTPLPRADVPSLPAEPVHPILELQDLKKSFGATAAVAGVSEAFPRGQYVCVLGPSGCGKTTLLRMIAGFERPDSGDIRLDGRSVLAVPPERRDVNVVFQSYALFPHLTVRENVAF